MPSKRNIVPEMAQEPAEKLPTGDLTAIAAAQLQHFEIDGEKFQIRQPTTEEYDEALSLQRVVYRRTLAQPHIKALADIPCTDDERSIYQGMLNNLEAEFAGLEESAKKRDLAREIARLQEELDDRTLAEETASERAVLARDRWLCARLLCGADGAAVLPPTTTPDAAPAWERLPLAVKDAARPAIWYVLTLVREAPFSWATLRGPR